MADFCPRCNNPLPPNDRPRPWCPHCGHELKAAAQTAPPAPAATSATPPKPVRASPSGFAGNSGLPYFHVVIATDQGRERGIMRVYVSDQELIFYALRVSSLDPLGDAQRAAMGGAVAAYSASLKYHREAEQLQRVTATLERADEQALRQLVDDCPWSFYVPVAACSAVQIDPGSFWKKLVGGYPATLQFEHPDYGQVVLGLVGLPDVTTAVQQMRRLYGDQARINVDWKSLR